LFVYNEGGFPNEVCTFCDTVGCIILFLTDFSDFWYEGSYTILYFLGNILCEWYVIMRSEDCSGSYCTRKLLPALYVFVRTKRNGRCVAVIEI
jgi:hypothetical protein